MAASHMPTVGHLTSSWMPPGLEGSSPLNRMAKEAAMMMVWDSSTIFMKGIEREEGFGGAGSACACQQVPVTARSRHK